MGFRVKPIFGPPLPGFRVWGDDGRPFSLNRVLGLQAARYVSTWWGSF